MWTCSGLANSSWLRPDEFLTSYRLPTHDKHRGLPATLDVVAKTEKEWDQLAAQRDAELESGAVVGIPLEEAMALLRTRFPGWAPSFTKT